MMTGLMQLFLMAMASHISRSGFKNVLRCSVLSVGAAALPEIAAVDAAIS